jgi:hypothetical protein
MMAELTLGVGLAVCAVAAAIVYVATELICSQAD